ncbi:MAG: NUDIX hydrolase [Pseudomonadota bacterium]
MADKKTIGPWTINAENVVYENPWLTLRHHDVIHPDGSDGIYGVVHYKNLAIGILPLFEDGSVPIVGQHRFPLDAYSWELPEGGGPHGEDPLESAKRELSEETGYSATNWAVLGEADLSNSVSDERALMFLAWGLVAGVSQPEASEELAHDRISFGQLLDRCLGGGARDALTQLMVLHALAQYGRGELPEGAAQRIKRGLEGA